MISLPNYDFQWARSELVIIYPDIWKNVPNHQPDICLKPPNEISPPDGPSTNPFNKKSPLKCKSHWIGLRGNVQETAETPIFNGKNYAFLQVVP